MDHVVPRHAGGGDSWWNLAGACRSCNASKGARPLLPWFPGPRGLLAQLEALSDEEREELMCGSWRDEAERAGRVAA
jgi:hypothetical protein